MKEMSSVNNDKPLNEDQILALNHCAAAGKEPPRTKEDQNPDDAGEIDQYVGSSIRN